MDKKHSRLRRARRTRMKIRELGVYRLSIFRTGRHTYAQIIAPSGSEVVASASTLQKEVVDGLANGGNIDAAKAVGKRIAEKAVEAGIKSVAFDRGGFKYHGRVKALADTARENGLEF